MIKIVMNRFIVKKIINKAREFVLFVTFLVITQFIILYDDIQWAFCFKKYKQLLNILNNNEYELHVRLTVLRPSYFLYYQIR